MVGLGPYIKKLREALNEKHSGFSIRAVAKRVGMHHSYLSRVERGEANSLDERRLYAIARELSESPDLLLALAGKLSPQITRVIHQNPSIFKDFMKKIEDSTEGQQLLKNKLFSEENRMSELEELSRRLRDEIVRNKELSCDIRNALNNYQTLFNFLPDAVVLADLNTGNVLDVNNAAEKIWKRSKEELLTLHQSDLHPQEENVERIEKFKVHGTRFLSREVKTVILDKEGNVVPVVVTASRVIIDGKQCVLGLFRLNLD